MSGLKRKRGRRFSLRSRQTLLLASERQSLILLRPELAGLPGRGRRVFRERCYRDREFVPHA